jgi:hypothetical protein
MKKFKTYDMWISILLINGCLIYSLINLDYTFLIGYCVVGGWQLISMIIHTANGWFTEKGSKRMIYHEIVLTVLLLALLGIWVAPLLYFVLLILLFAAPCMAVFYTMMCYKEITVKMQRPLALLK